MTPPIWETPVTPENVNNLTDTELDIVLNSEKAQAKIAANLLSKIPEFEKNTFRIDSAWWKEETRHIQWQWPVSLKVNPQWDVLEFVDGPAKWEQLFITYNGFIREACAQKGVSKEVLEQKYLPTPEKLTKMAGGQGPGKEQYKTFYEAATINKHLAGYRMPDIPRFHETGKSFFVRLAQGNSVQFDISGWYRFDNRPSRFNYKDLNAGHGLSGLLLKD